MQRVQGRHQTTSSSGYNARTHEPRGGRPPHRLLRLVYSRLLRTGRSWADRCIRVLPRQHCCLRPTYSGPLYIDVGRTDFFHTETGIYNHLSQTFPVAMFLNGGVSVQFSSVHVSQINGGVSSNGLKLGAKCSSTRSGLRWRPQTGPEADLVFNTAAPPPMRLGSTHESEASLDGDR